MGVSEPPKEYSQTLLSEIDRTIDKPQCGHVHLQTQIPVGLSILSGNILFDLGLRDSSPQLFPENRI